jgi:3-isopropylmalate dehydrogenase
VFDGLVDASTLKADVVRGLDLMIVRESTGGVYFGEPRGIETLADGTERGFNTDVYTTPEIERVAAIAFDLARGRQGRVTSVEKANVMEAGVLWRRVVQRVRDRDHTDVALDHMYADNCAMQLVRRPKQFDVILTSNLFGDLLSDLASMCTGSLGLLPSATLGPVDAAGKRPALYEPIHGSAPDIVGQDKANPVAQVMSLAMLLRWSLDDHAAADRVERACEAALARVRTPDIAGDGLPTVGTAAMGDAILAELA